MDKNKSLTHAAYLIAALLFVLPLVDSVMRVWPMQMGDNRWRFQFLGALSSATLVPLIGLLVALAAALYIGSTRVRRSVGVLSLVVAAVTAIVMFLFVADYFQVRSLFAPNLAHAAGIATVIAVVKFLVTIAVLVLFGMGGLRWSPKARAA